MRRVLRVASCMADNAMPFPRELSAWLGARLGLEARFVDDVPWQERERALYHGEIDLCWLCGLPYARRRDAFPASLEPAVAAVPAAERYRGEAIYFSDVIVRAGYPARGLGELRGARWTFNERNSHSGYNAVLAHLARTGAAPGFFGALAESGSHQEALRRVLAGGADAAAVDSTVLETELRREPALARRLRVVGSLGPSPAPPWVFSGAVEAELRAASVERLVRMHLDARGRAILAAADFARLVKASDPDYDPIRRDDDWARRYAAAA